MADSKWIISVDWSIAKWTDETLFVFLSYLWPPLKEASDERQAFIEQVFNTSFDSDNEFPGFGFDGITLSGPGMPNNIERIINALNNTSGTKFDFVKTDTIAADGTTVAAGNLADYLDLSDILTDVFSYASGELLIALDTDDGDESAIWQMKQLKQLYEVMNYTQYYARQIINSTDSFFSEIATQEMNLVVQYDYNTLLGTFLKGEADYTNAPNSTVDLYTTNDLNESAPFSTPQDVFDYTESTFDGEISTADWVTTSTGVAVDITASASMSITLTGSGNIVLFESSIFRRRLRVKVTDNKRAVSPATYIAVLKYYFFLTEADISVFNAFGTGVGDRETEFMTMVADGNDYYYLETATQPDYSSFTVPSVPTVDGNTNTRFEGFRQFSLNEFTNITTPILGSRRTDIMIEANNSDGTAFEYYSP